mgnify:CR=1 FL=1
MPGAVLGFHGLGFQGWVQLRSAHAVQPPHRHTLAGMTVDLEILVPGGAQGDVELVAEGVRVVPCPFHAAAHMVLGEDAQDLLDHLDFASL